MTIAELVHRISFGLRNALEAEARGDYVEARGILADLFYEFDELLLRLPREERAALKIRHPYGLETDEQRQ